MWQRIRTLIVKEFLAIWRDPKSRMILIVPPLVELLVFSFAATQEVKDVRIAVLNRDIRHQLPGTWWRCSSGFAEFLVDSIPRRAKKLRSPRRSISRERVMMVVSHLKPISHASWRRVGRKLQLMLDGRRSNAAQIVEGYATAIVGRFNEQLLTAD